jgi:hypothetical protein
VLANKVKNKIVIFISHSFGYSIIKYEKIYFILHILLLNLYIYNKKYYFFILFYIEF